LSSPGTIYDEEFRTPQPAIDEVREDSSPGLGALAAHALDREEHLLAVFAHAENNQQRIEVALRSSRVLTGNN